MHSIGVIGGGAWGTALAQAFASTERDVLLWAREPEVVDSINTAHENEMFLKGIKLSPALKAINDIKALTTRDILLLVTPAQHLRSTLKTLKDLPPHLSPPPLQGGRVGRGGNHLPILVICAKGIEMQTGKLLSEICEEIFPENPYAILTGPTFASEIARGLPCAVTIATKNKDAAKILQTALGTKKFRPYFTDDIIGTQLGGALKNVIAIASGVVHGKGLGESARAAIMTRGVAELAELAAAMGARRETLLDMCGIGDLMLTASSMQSRNFSLGAALGEGQSMDEILSQRNAVTEGVHTAESALALAKKYNVTMPITETVNRCLKGELSIDQAILDLMARPVKGL